MRGDPHPAGQTIRACWYIWTIVEGTGELTFRAMLLSLSRQVEPSLDAWGSEHAVVLASPHQRVARQIGENGPCAIGSIQTPQGKLCRKRGGFEASPNGLEALAPFLTRRPIPAVSQTAEPLRTVGRSDGGAGTDHRILLATSGARSTDRGEAALRFR
jgi:hypothetical protein